ncbi:uncharacterized protein STAUR_1502 [Stigmatella aurantiaca DW4/3-1]|uniref:Uncharacterized protein n=1 Tax=Stigmatella aurantiaca (strain DW4/3-1) TaxID=378806 RepID=E3FMA7_STIAD|nr:uncharacterized protein STAUR_1502 [Stigmatella aurantiaca DW4/3-1]
MALSPDTYRRAALAAELHVQVQIDRVVLPPVMPGNAQVEGRIARVFRGDPGLTSSRISFEVSCARDWDELPTGGPLCMSAADVERAVAMEVYLISHGHAAVPLRGVSRTAAAC